MKTYTNDTKWIWESENFPNFIYVNTNLENLNGMGRGTYYTLIV